MIVLAWVVVGLISLFLIFLIVCYISMWTDDEIIFETEAVYRGLVSKTGSYGRYEDNGLYYNANKQGRVSILKTYLPFFTWRIHGLGVIPDWSNAALYLNKIDRSIPLGLTSTERKIEQVFDIKLKPKEK